MRWYSRHICESLTAVVVLCGVAQAQTTRDLIEQALDQPVAQLEIRDQPIAAALSQIDRKTGLQFTLDPAVADLLPYGQQTRVTIEIRNLAVRAAMRSVLDGLGLEMEVQRDRIVLVPAPVLIRLSRRLVVAETQVLQRLSQGSWEQLKESDRPALEFRIDPVTQPLKALQQALAQVQGVSGLRQLESATQTLHWVWRPEGERIIVERQRDDFRRRLEFPIDISFARAALDGVIVDLGQRVGVPMLFEPGVLKRVEARDRAVDLIQRQTSVLQVLERICGNTGLRYEITDEGVRFAPAQPTSQPSAGGEAPWTRVSVEVEDGLRVDVLMRLDQLRPDIRQKVERRLNEVLLGSRAINEPGRP